MFDRQPENIRRTALYAMSYWVVYTYRAEEANNNTGDDVQFWSDVAMDNVLLIQVDSTHSQKSPPPKFDIPMFTCTCIVYEGLYTC